MSPIQSRHSVDVQYLTQLGVGRHSHYSDPREVSHMSSSVPQDLATNVEPPEFVPRPVPPLAPSTTRELASEIAARSPLAGLRHVGLGVPNLREAVAFYEGIWGLY